MNPKVSVIIPNFNHARFLDRRINSVQNQTFKDFEIIILDDYSTDHSRDIIHQFASKDSRISIHFNKQNNGSPFKQWKKGVEMAQGKFIWIAESDDFADREFLVNLMNIFSNQSEVGIAYCQSNFVDSKSEVVGNHNKILNSLDPNLWKNDFCLNGKEVLSRYMTIMNIIPNASAVVFKKELIKNIDWETLMSFKLAGDRYFWVSLLLKTNLYFISKSLNYFRVDGDTVRARHDRSLVYLLEILSVVTIITRNVYMPVKSRLRVLLAWVKKFSSIKKQNPKIIYEINAGIILNASKKIFRILLGV